MIGSRTMAPGVGSDRGLRAPTLFGDRVLTRVHNYCAGLTLSEWNSGYRAYNLSRLEMDSVSRMSDAFDFDTEIILSLAQHGRRLVEIQIPTFYGAANRHARGVRHAADALADSMRFRVRRSRNGTAKRSVA